MVKNHEERGEKTGEEGEGRGEEVFYRLNEIPFGTGLICPWHVLMEIIEKL